MAEEELQTEAAPAESAFGSAEFASLLQKEFRPKSDQAKTAVEAAVKTLAEQALANTGLISDDALRSIESIVAEIDKKLTEQVNLILHNEEFQQLESAWRGLHYLVNNTESDEQLKIRVLNISKPELHKTLKKFKGTAWDQSPVFKKMYEEEYGQFGGEPYGCLVGDYYFDQSPQDVELLGETVDDAMEAGHQAAHLAQHQVALGRSQLDRDALVRRRRRLPDDEPFGDEGDGGNPERQRDVRQPRPAARHGVRHDILRVTLRRGMWRIHFFAVVSASL